MYKIDILNDFYYANFILGGVCLFLIYDDEKASSEMLLKKLRSFEEFKETPILTVNSREDAEQCINDSLEVLFQDIELGEDGNGIDFVKNLKDRFPDLIIVFISAYNSYSQEIFAASPDAFILKPFEDNSVERAVKIIKDKMLDNKKSIVLQIGSHRLINIELRDVLYITKCQKDVNFINFENETKYSVKCSIDDIEKKLPPEFLRTHQGYIVNMKYIKEMRNKSFVIQNDFEIPISLKFASSKEKYLKFLGEMI